MQVISQQVFIALLEIRLHLQGFDGFHADDVFGEESLIARAFEKLVIDPLAQHGGDGDAQHRQQHHRGHGNQRELPAIPEHHRQKHKQERQIQKQRHRRAADELADSLHAVQTRDQRAGRPLLEIAQMQSHQMAEHLAAEYGVDAVAGMQNEILPQPSQKSVENQEDG